MNGFGDRYRAVPRAALKRAATPPSGDSPEAIWHCLFDTQTYTDNATTRLTFFQTTNADPTLSNMEASGQLPSPQYLNVYNINLDAWTAIPVSQGANVVGDAGDLALLLLTGRPVWTFTLANKTYGPYPLTTLHGTGGPDVFGWGFAHATDSIQFAKVDKSPGWNYYGRVIIPPQQSFKIDVVFAAAQNLTADWRLRISIMGVLSRRVL
jgi:hypothetical protein